MRLVSSLPPAGGQACRRTRAGPGPRDAGLAEVLGSMLLIAVTVIAAAALMTTLSKFQRTEGEDTFAELALGLAPGANDAWGTGDEVVTLSHLGGDKLNRASVTVSVLVGSTGTAFSGADLGGGFGDETLTIGETWSEGFTVAQGQAVLVDVYRDGKSVLFSGTTAPEAS